MLVLFDQEVAVFEYDSIFGKYFVPLAENITVINKRIANCTIVRLFRVAVDVVLE
jgi:hypothetical protein